jgi:zona occludens toxin (predicted ATPase)
MIRLITGLPGSGKSLRAIWYARKAISDGRSVYIYGIDGLQDFGWLPLDDPNQWESLPDGSLVIIDEAQKVWPTRRSGDAPPYIKALSEHRHHGFDFILVTQHPSMLDAYVRKLVGTHEHVIRQFGAQVSKVITWGECYDDPQSLATRQRGTESLWKYPTDCYSLYKSATLHTVKRLIPFRVAIIPILLLLTCVLSWFAYKSVRSVTGKHDSSSVSQDQSKSGVVPPIDSALYLRQYLPRVAGMPWSAPWHDNAKPTAKPDILCVFSESKGCRCYTEQITRLDVPMLQCIQIAKNGIYNPFRDPLPQSQDTQSSVASSDSSHHKDESLPVPTKVPPVLTRQPMNVGSVR